MLSSKLQSVLRNDLLPSGAVTCMYRSFIQCLLNTLPSNPLCLYYPSDVYCAAKCAVWCASVRVASLWDVMCASVRVASLWDVMCEMCILYMWYTYVWYDIWYDMWYDVIWYDISVNCSWVVTRWQYTFTHKQYIEQHK